MNNKVVYTCITGDYDRLKDPLIVTKDFDYVCFTDSTIIKSNIWQIRPLPKEVKNLSQVKKQRYIKINPHLFLGEYDLSIWVDGCVLVVSDLNEFVNSVIKDDCSVYVPQHPIRNCSYHEANVIVDMMKCDKETVDKQMNKYRQEGFPTNYGLLQSNIMLRKHNDINCIRLMRIWSNEVMKGCHRDQLSFNYAEWKSKTKITYLDKKLFISSWFYWNGVHKGYKGYKPQKNE